MIQTIEQILTDNHYLKDGKVIGQNEVAKIKLNKKTEQVLAAKVDYIIDYYGKSELQQFFTEDLSKKHSISINERLNIESVMGKYLRNDYFNYSLNKNQETIDIQSFNELITLNKDYNSDELFSDSKYTATLKDNQIYIQKAGESKPSVIIPLDKKISELENTEEDEKSKNKMTIDGSNYSLIINYISGNYENGAEKIVINQLEADLFLK